MASAKKTLKIATRGSALALWQARFVQKLLQEINISSELLVIKTEGDRVQDRFLHEIGGKGLFIKELEEALVDGRADLAMHSLKDMPAKVEEPFTLAAILKRHAPTDVLVADEGLALRLGGRERGLLGAEELARLGKIKVATASLRRTSLLRQYAPSIGTVGIRGNVDTRVRKLHSESFDALILAEASMDRLQIKTETYRTLDPTWFIPAPGQGALAIEMLADHPLLPQITALDHEPSRLAVTIERQVLHDLGGDCTMPFGCHVVERPGGRLEARATVLDYDGNAATIHLADRPRHVELASEIFAALEKEGAQAILATIRSQEPSLPS